MNTQSANEDFDRPHNDRPFFFVGWLLRVLFFSDAAENFGYVSTMFHWLTFDSDINNARP